MHLTCSIDFEVVLMNCITTLCYSSAEVQIDGSHDHEHMSDSAPFNSIYFYIIIQLPFISVSVVMRLPTKNTSFRVRRNYLLLQLADVRDAPYMELSIPP